MRYALAPVALAALVVATPVPQGVTENISPDAATPSGCQTSYDGEFNIQIVNVTSTKRSLSKRQSNILTMTLADGVLTDSQGRTGYIAANSQFQFDAPPQTGAIYTSGWSVCGNGHLTLGDDDTFYSCLSGNFYNLYDENVLNAQQCNPVYINVVGSSGGAASVMPDGQPTGSAVSVMPDGQPTGAPVSQIPDGQITGSAVPSAVSQQPDGQITGAPVSQIPDGQIQQHSAPAAPVSQIPDGQVQATSAVSPIQQISDGQVQATPAPSAVASQIPDGQPQLPTVLPSASSGFMPPANTTMAYPSIPVQTDNGAPLLSAGSGVGMVAALFGLLMI